MARSENLRDWYGKITRRADSPYWQRSYAFPGRPFDRRSLKTTDKDEAARKVRDEWQVLELKARQAELLAAGIITQEQVKPRVELTLKAALERYMTEHGDKLPSHVNLRGYNTLILETLDADTLPSTFDTADAHELARELSRRVVRYADGERPIAPGSVNHHVKHLRAVMRRAKKLWNVSCTPEEIDWGAVMLAEADHVRRIIEDTAEEEAILANADPDLGRLIEFSVLSGVRAANAYGLKKSQVNWKLGQIELWVKSKKRRADGGSGRLQTVMITPDIEAVLRSGWDDHPEFVFTYVCRKSRTWTDRMGVRHAQRKGQRYPYTKSSLSDRWDEIRKALGLKALKWHGLRATFATRHLNDPETPPPLVRDLMGHADMSTTMRYYVPSAQAQREALLRQEQKRATARQLHKAGNPKLKVMR
jgi:integrase